MSKLTIDGVSVVFKRDGADFEALAPVRIAVPAGQFIRIHRSYIINKGRMDHMEKGRVAIGNNFLPIGDTYREEVMTRLGF